MTSKLYFSSVLHIIEERDSLIFIFYLHKPDIILLTQLLSMILVSSFCLQAKEYFEKAADNKEAGGHYNLGVMYLKGIGVKRDVKIACNYFIIAANAGQPKSCLATV